MKPEKSSQKVLSVTQAKAKMLEYNIPEKYQNINFDTNPQKLFRLTIGLLGEYSHKFIQNNESSDEELLKSKYVLKFSSRFFDAYVQSGLDTTLDEYLILLGSATYYLCDMPGHSSVLINKMGNGLPDLGAYELEKTLFWLLKYNVPIEYTGIYSRHLQSITQKYVDFIKNGIGESDILKQLKNIREVIYEDDIPRCILFIDIISAILKLKVINSCWKALPEYSGIDIDAWKSIIQKSDFIKEFWPAQHLIGEKGVLRGKSAVIQMPTSAGKTKASELIIRSAFIHETTLMAIIVAPFRALCHEISSDLSKALKNEGISISELTDTLQMDMATEQLQGKKQILIVTPEKLFYIISHNKEIALLSNLFIFDEGHQFDNGIRGITYELLLTTLLLLLPNNTQKVLISAVINNAHQISNWLNGNDNIVSGSGLLPTFKTIGFVSWKYTLGQIHYINEEDTHKEEYFVPRVIEQTDLNKLERERNIRKFPEKSNKNSISLYLGLKLVTNGSVAIFCGRKNSVTSICEILFDIMNRGYILNASALIPSHEEVEMLTYLYAMNMGEDSVAAKSAKQGIFSHHNNIPHGIRIAVEYAMRENKIKFIICTSTLAQGVNLPIRYLIIPSYYQAGEKIKTRDFHNLIGRVGRAGMHTEGSILFTNPEIFDKKDTYKGKWEWERIQDLLNPSNNEPCSSDLLTIFEPLKDNNGKNITSLKIEIFLERYFNSLDLVDKLIEKIFEDNPNGNFTKESLEYQFSNKIRLISAIENFMLSNWDEIEALKGENDFSDIVTKTLGYSLADNETKESLKKLFECIENTIIKNIIDSEKRKLYGRTLYGIMEATYIEAWFTENSELLLSATSVESLFDLLWLILKRTFTDKTNIKLININRLKLIIEAWISGVSYSELLNIFQQNDLKKQSGKTSTDLNIEDVIDICDNKIVFDGCMVLSAVYEFASQNSEKNQDMMLLLQNLQRRLKYGLPDEASIIIFELGFCDRIIAQDIKNTLTISGGDRLKIIHTIKTNREPALNCISKYPTYYQVRMNNLIN